MKDYVVSECTGRWLDLSLKLQGIWGDVRKAVDGINKDQADEYVKKDFEPILLEFGKMVDKWLMFSINGNLESLENTKKGKVTI